MNQVSAHAIKVLRSFQILCVFLILSVASSGAQQITGATGSPSGTISIDGNQLPPPPMKFEFDYKYDGLGVATLAFNNVSGIGRSGTGVLKVDGKELASQKMERTLPVILQWDESLSDTGHTGGRQRLSDTIRLHRQDRQDHIDDQSTAAFAAGCEDSDASRAEQ